LATKTFFGHPALPQIIAAQAAQLEEVAESMETLYHKLHPRTKPEQPDVHVEGILVFRNGIQRERKKRVRSRQS
jgi:hypothetical protein